MDTSREGITRFGLRNFKSFHYLEDMELRPLTVLVGPNNSGKSSVLQSLALLKQTLLTSSTQSSLKFDGDLVQLENFETVISGFDVSKPIEYRFQISTKVPSKAIKAYFPHINVPDIDVQKE